MSVNDYIQSITQNAPVKGIRYDEYEPQKYNSITVDVKGKGLAYCGITLISPCSIHSFIEVIKDYAELSELKELSAKALNEKRWMIHFGL